jgi:hypothetical protein
MLSILEQYRLSPQLKELQPVENTRRIGFSSARQRKKITEAKQSADLIDVLD